VQWHHETSLGFSENAPPSASAWQKQAGTRELLRYVASRWRVMADEDERRPPLSELATQPVWPSD
jgi:hypothetical protein